MSRKNREEKLLGFRERNDVFFIGDKKRNWYHQKGCSQINSIVKNDLLACGPNPEKEGLKPCPFCKPSPVKVEKKKPDSRASLLQKALISCAVRYNMHIRFTGPTAYVSTIDGEWFFNYTTDKIVLYHKNQETWHDKDGNARPGDFHVQKVFLPSPLEALSYIYRHEQASENRLFLTNLSQILVKYTGTEKDNEKLFIGNKPIIQGQSVIALFPDGWHRVTLTAEEDTDGALRWRIETPGFESYSPIGLFVVI